MAARLKQCRCDICIRASGSNNGRSVDARTLESHRKSAIARSVDQMLAGEDNTKPLPSQRIPLPHGPLQLLLAIEKTLERDYTSPKLNLHKAVFEHSGEASSDVPALRSSSKNNRDIFQHKAGLNLILQQVNQIEAEENAVLDQRKKTVLGQIKAPSASIETQIAQEWRRRQQVPESISPVVNCGMQTLFIT